MECFSTGFTYANRPGFHVPTRILPERGRVGQCQKPVGNCFYKLLSSLANGRTPGRVPKPHGFQTLGLSLPGNPSLLPWVTSE